VSAVDDAGIGNPGAGGISGEIFVVTKCHASEKLEETFWFAKNAALHPEAGIQNTLILHIGSLDKRNMFKKMYKDA
jgi:hypothetical protein